ncbi:MAG: chemotaxis protein CheB [Gammaproteobacteria bacterium]|nr:chemotaxis protein CheB [Gammaproteobacteria bacterium]
MNDNLKLLVVDDSKIMRDAIVGMFAGQNIVIEQATDGLEALVLVQTFRPDVVTMDISMPGLDGIGTLKRMMIEHPVPTVMLSSLAQEGAKITFDALRYGAVDFICKPSALVDVKVEEQIEEIQGRVKFASEVEIGAIKYIRYEEKIAGLQSEINEAPCRNIVAIGAAEGGYGALLKIIPQLSADSNAAFLVSLHAAAEHVDAFISYLKNYCRIPVKRALHNELIRPGICYISSGMDYMSVHREIDELSLHISPAPFSGRRGAIDMLLFSTAEAMCDSVIGVILSGQGEDGAEGLEEVMRIGGRSVVQHPKTCFCKEMVQAAIDRNIPDYLIADIDIATTIHEIMG